MSIFVNGAKIAEFKKKQNKIWAPQSNKNSNMADQSNLFKPGPVLGLMSGTSLDGLDLALCEFEKKGESYAFRIIKAHTIEYTEIWRQRLSSLKDASAEKYFTLHALYGKFIGEKVLEFCADLNVTPAAIASHGHTVFHQPHMGFSTQTGCPATIAAITGITTVADFRSLDVALGGQGAPLVPVGDKLLFGDYQACLNLGGIANISYDENGKRIAYDVCVANMLLNYLSEQSGKSYDAGGESAKAGNVDQSLLNALNDFDFFSQKGAKSIGREWFEKNIKPLVDNVSLHPNDLMATCVEHIAYVIAAELNSAKIKNVLVTGGGAFNDFLIERLKSKTGCEIILPQNDIINFKEALIFAFLGYLRLHGITNTLSSVTGAQSDSAGGAVYLA